MGTKRTSIVFIKIKQGSGNSQSYGPGLTGLSTTAYIGDDIPLFSAFEHGHGLVDDHQCGWIIEIFFKMLSINDTLTVTPSDDDSGNSSLASTGCPILFYGFFADWILLFWMFIRLLILAFVLHAGVLHRHIQKAF